MIAEKCRGVIEDYEELRSIPEYLAGKHSIENYHR